MVSSDASGGSQQSMIPISRPSSKSLCAITGSNGYLGSCIKNHFKANGWDVVELVRRPHPGDRAAAFHLGGEIPANAFAGVTALVHCAYDFRPLAWPEIRAVNVVGTEKLFQAARAAGVANTVCVSSISAFDGCRSRYGKAKLEIEKVALEYGAQVIRPGLVYGRGAGGMFGRLRQQVEKSSVIPLIGDGSQIQFLVHQDDLCDFIGKYAAGKTAGLAPILTAAHSQPWAFKQLLIEIARGLDRKITFIPVPWRLVWLGLKAAETCGLGLSFRSDSLVSLMHQNARPDFSANARAGLACRPFDISRL